MTHGSKKLGRLVLGAILAAGAGIWTPSVEAANYVYIDADVNDTVTVSGGPAPGTVYPAAGTTDTTSLTITGGAWDGWTLKGGQSTAKGLTGYSLTLDRVTGTNMNGIYGATSGTGINISDNQLTLENVDVAMNNNNWIAGGYSSAAGSKVQSNTLTIKSGKATANAGGTGGLVGGVGVIATDIDVTENHLVIEGGEVNGAYVGGGGGPRNAEGNTVKISGGTVKTVVLFGGYSAGDGSGNANGNKVTISGGTVDMSASANGLYGGYVFGGANTTGGASNNEVLISGGTVKGDIRGGRVQSGTGSATENKVTISNGSITAEGVVGGEAVNVNGNAADNIVMISGGTTAGNLVGGLSHTGNATGNAVTISSGTVGTTNAHGVYGGEAFNGAADNNIVTISGGTISGSVWGGNGKTATGNTVTISGGTFAADAFIHGAFANGAATNNTVNILTQIAVGGLAGGESMTDAASSTGNTLNLAATGVTTGDLYAFQNLNFYLPTNMSKTDTMLTVSGTAEVDGAKVGVMAQGKLANLAKDDKVTLLHANTLNGTVSQTTEIDVPESIAKVNTYEFNVTSDANNIYATITKAPEEGGGEGGGGSKNAETRENTKSVVETKAATTTFVNAGADMLASQGFSEAANAVAMEMAESAKNGGKGSPIVSSFTPFAAFGGSSMRAESGSYVDTRGFGLNIGFARELSNAQGKLLFGPVVEYGGGNYDSYLDNGVHGEGGSHYFGVGIMARQVNRDGFYYEGSVRGGRVTSDYKGTFNLQNVNYDSSSNYWAAHLGIGKAFAVGGSNTLDGYVKYFYSHQAGDSVTMHTTAGADEDWNFDSVDSHRIRIGARLTHKINDKSSLYGGLAYQYEFGGEATAHYNGGSTPSPSVKGSSGMLELGWQVKPNNGPLTLDLGVTGWAGKQRGGSVQLGATWSF